MHKLMKFFMCVLNFFDQSHTTSILKHFLNIHTAFLSFIQNALLKHFISKAFPSPSMGNLKHFCDPFTKFFFKT